MELETESLGMRMFFIGRAVQTFDGPDSDMEPQCAETSISTRHLQALHHS